MAGVNMFAVKLEDLRQEKRELQEQQDALWDSTDPGERLACAGITRRLEEVNKRLQEMEAINRIPHDCFFSPYWGGRG